MAPSNLGVGDTVTNGLEAYEILEQIRNGEESSLYRVLCKSGRLRNRQLALKKVLIPTSSSTAANPHLITTTSLHQALHHPNIVSLLSAFCTTRETFHVLELCSVGSLSQFIRSRSLPTLLEPELRGVTKSLADALTYLRRELVIHGDINPSNILLTGDYGVKLSNFKHAFRLSNRDSTASSFHGASSYSAPEMASGGSYGFSVDIWSLGCVMVYCASGLGPLDDKSVPRSRNWPARPVYDLPEHLSNDAKELISRTLHVIPEERIYLPDILSHPFLANNMPITSLRPSATLSASSQKSFGNLSRPSRNDQSLEPSRFKISQATRGMARHASDQSSQNTRSRTKFILGDIGNLNLRSMLSDEVTSSKISLSAGQTRRVVSDPIRRRPVNPPGIEALNMYTPVRPPAVQINHTAPAPRIRQDPDLCSAIPCAPSPVSDAKSSKVTQIPHEGRIPVYEDRDKHNDLDDEEMKIPASLLKLPVGTARPIPLNTTTLGCQTHKTPYGQITILPSHSLLVDFRESQRRKGLKGNEVFVIEPEGSQISVFSAPHLSSPCCLVEPKQRFSIEGLPSIYWKQYNDAARLLSQIKQRTPKLVVYAVAAKCTLMANAPQADIELLFNNLTPSPSKDSSASDPSLRIRFSRQSQSLEFARHISSPRGEEWTKKVLISKPEPPYLSMKDWKGLEQAEKNAMHHLTRFVRTCDAVEGEVDTTSPLSAKTTHSTAEEIKIRIPATLQKPNHRQEACDLSGSMPAITSTLSSFNFAPRPSKLSVPTTARPTLDLRYSIPAAPQEFVAQEHETSSKRVLSNSAWRDDLDLTVGSRGMQTRFIPSVGWCIRYASRVSQGGRYRMMFLDGVALDIDVDEDWVEFKSQAGETTVYNIRDCGSKRKIGERMKVFEEFVLLFEDSEAE